MKPKQVELKLKELEAIRHIRNFIVHKGRTPSTRELRDMLGYKSPRSAQEILDQLNKYGIINKEPNGSYRLVTNPDLGPSHAQTVDVPLVGVVACGVPIFAQQNIEGYIPISTTLAHQGSKYFLLHASGDSMNEAGINDGDLVLVRQQNTANEGDKVVALINDEATIKEFHKSNNLVILKPRSTNPVHRPIVLSEDFQIQGIVKSVIGGDLLTT